MSGQLKAYLLLAVAMSIAGSSVVAGKLMILNMPVFLATELGIVAGLLFLVPLALVQWKEQAHRDKQTHLILFMQALFGVVLYRVFIFWGLQSTTATASGLIGSAAPALITLMAFLFLREKTPGNRIAGAISVSVGILAVNLLPFLNDSMQAADALKGNFLVLLGVLSESVFSIMSKFQCRPMTVMFRTAMVALYAAICLLPFALRDALSYDFSAMNIPSLLCVGYYGFFVSFLSYFFWFKGIADVPAGVAATFTGFVPLTSLVLSWLILHEQITMFHLIGLICVLMGIYLSCAFEKTPNFNKVKVQSTS